MRQNPYVGPRSFRTGETLYGRDRELRRLLDLLIAERIVLLHAPSGAGKTSLVQAALLPRLQAEGFAVLPPIRVSTEAEQGDKETRRQGDKEARRQGDKETRRPEASGLLPSSLVDTIEADRLLRGLLGLDDLAGSGEGMAPSAPSVARRSGPDSSAVLRPSSAPSVARRSGPDSSAVLRPSSVRIAAPPVPNRYLLSALLSLEEGLPVERQIPLERLGGMSFGEYLDLREGELEANDGVVLIFDQFEEVLTVDPTDAAAKEAFFAQIGAALFVRHRWALFSMRDDFVGSIEPYLRPIPTQLANTFHLDLLDVKAAIAAMQGPVRAVGAVFTDAAARQLADDLRRVSVLHADGSASEQLGPHIEPVQLQVVCFRLWERLPAEDSSIDPEDVAALGDVDQALTGYYAERVRGIAAATGVEERAIRDWCEGALITEQGIRGQVIEGAAGLAPQAIRGLVDAHLVRGEKRRGATWFELAHDRLIAPVRKDNAAWREANLSALQRQAALWERQARPAGMLLRDAALAEAEDWAAANAALLTASERDFLQASREARAVVERERRNVRRIRVLALVSALTAIIAVAVAVFAGLAFLRAEEQSKIALIRQLAAEAADSRERDPARAVLLALEAVRRAADAGLGVPEANGALRRSLAPVTGQGLFQAEPGTTQPYYNFVEQLLLSPDGQLVALRDTDGDLSLWSTTGKRQDLAAAPGLGGVSAIGFSPDGRWFVAGDTYGILAFWRSADLSAPPLVRAAHTVTIIDLAFSPDSRSLATASYDDTAMLWDLGDPAAPPRRLEGHKSDLETVAFSPDGRSLATGDDDGLTFLWDLASGQLVEQLEKHDSWVVDVLFSPDGRWLLTRSQPGVLHLWDRANLSTGFRLLEVENESFTSATFRPDGQRLAALGSAGALIWDLTAAAEAPQPLGDSASTITALAFASDGRLFSGSKTGSIQIWDLSASDPLPLTLRGNTGAVSALAVSAEHGLLLSKDKAGVVRRWNLADPLRSVGVELLRHTSSERIWFTVLDNAQQLLVNTSDGALLYDSSQEPLQPPVELPRFERFVDPEQQLIATRNATDEIQIWDRRDLGRVPPGVALTPDDTIQQITPDGRYALVNNREGINPRRIELPTQSSPGGSVRIIEGAGYATFISPDGRYVAYSSDAGYGVVDLSSGSPRPLALPSEDTEIRFAVDNYLLTFSEREGAWLRRYDDLNGPGVSLPADVNMNVRGMWGARSRYIYLHLVNDSAVLWDREQPAAPARLLPDIDPKQGLIWFDQRFIIARRKDTDALLVWSQADISAAPIQLGGFKLPKDTYIWGDISPDGRYLTLIESDSNELLVWDLRNPALAPHQLDADEVIKSIEFSPDSATLAVGDSAGTIRLWNMADPVDPLELNNQVAIVSLSYSASGHTLLSTDTDGDLRAWSVVSDELPAKACAVAGRNLSPREWQSLFPQEPYALACPDFGPHASLVGEARELARRGEIDPAVERFEQALSLGATLPTEPPIEARRIYAAVLIQQLMSKFYQEQYDEAIALFEQAHALDPQLATSRDTLEQFCSMGAYAGRGSEVLAACDLVIGIVQALPAEYPARHTYQLPRAIARMQANDRAGAITDLRAYIAGEQTNANATAREAGWLTTLERGENPFTEEVLQELGGGG